MAKNIKNNDCYLSLTEETTKRADSDYHP